MVVQRCEEHTHRMNQNRKLAIAAVVVVLTSVVVLAISALSSDPTVLDPASPEGVVQQYVTAVTDEDWVAARALFTPGLADKCTVSDMSQSRMDNVSRVSIDDVSQSDGSAIIKVIIKAPN